MGAREGEIMLYYGKTDKEIRDIINTDYFKCVDCEVASTKHYMEHLRVRCIECHSKHIWSTMNEQKNQLQSS